MSTNLITNEKKGGRQYCLQSCFQNQKRQLISVAISSSYEE